MFATVGLLHPITLLSAVRRLSSLLRPGFAGHAAVCLLVLALGAVLRAEVTVFRDGRALLPVYVAAGAVPEEKRAAEELARVLGAMSGLRWSVQTEPTGQGPGFFLGRTRAAESRLPALRPAKDLLAPTAGEVGPDGFRIRTIGERVFIEGATPEALPFAVAWLLQRYGGVRWYAPGALGEVIPVRNEWTLPDIAIVREPAYVSREISGLNSEDDRAWGRRNGLRGRLVYSHNLIVTFPPELYDAHPEWFGQVRGVRRRPAGGGDYHWQPDLARAEVAEHAAEQAAAAFAREPGRASYSLGMNDTMRFDQGEGTQAAVLPLRYFRGMPDYSPLIFGFMNRSAAALPASLEGRYLGCLAYFWCENVPPFPVDPRVVPYVTTDRTQFYDPAYRAADYALMSRWDRSGVKAYGIWEYAEGSQFVVPRVPHAMLAEAVHEAWWRGARGYIGECGPHAGFDAFKVWMLAQLLWEPDRPLAELKEDFFTGWYGPAAEPMRRFFARCEQAWMAQPGPPWWIKFYQQADQVSLFPPELCRELRALLGEAEAKARECGNQEIRNGTVGQGADLAADSGAGESGTQEIRNGGKTTEAGNSERGTENGERAQTGDRTPETGDRWTVDRGRLPVIETQNAEPRTLNRESDGATIAARIALTGQAFAVTEAAVAFGAERGALAAAEARSWTPETVGERLVSLQRSRTELERALAAAIAAGAMRAMAIDYLTYDDPVPGVLAELGAREGTAPGRALAKLLEAGIAVPERWAALATASADGRLAEAKNRLIDGRFWVVAAGGQQPRFLFPRSGDIPANWDVQAMATEHGRVALGPMGPTGRILRIEGAWDTQVRQARPASPGRLYVAEVRMQGRSSPGNDAALSLLFLDAAGKIVGEYRTAALPKGESAWRTLTVADRAPAGTTTVLVSLVVLRQFGGDWVEATEASLREVE